MKLLRLEEVLTDKGVTGKELASKVYVTPTSISRIVTGQTFPKPELLADIAQALDVDIRDLFISTREQSTEPIYRKNEDGSYQVIGELKV